MSGDMSSLIGLSVFNHFGIYLFFFFMSKTENKPVRTIPKHSIDSERLESGAVLSLVTDSNGEECLGVLWGLPCSLPSIESSVWPD